MRKDETNSRNVKDIKEKVEIFILAHHSRSFSFFSFFHAISRMNLVPINIWGICENLVSEILREYLRHFRMGYDTIM